MTVSDFSSRWYQMGITSDLQDAAFAGGQRRDAESLGDAGSGTGASFEPSWDTRFMANNIHGVFLVAGDSWRSVDGKLQEVMSALGSTVSEVMRLRGDARPGGREQLRALSYEPRSFLIDMFGWVCSFGFLDGVTQPAVSGVDLEPFPGQDVVRQGVILAGREGDPCANTRPPWALDGSFLVFRYLAQKVPEFDQFLRNNPVGLQWGLTPEEGSELRGARLVGRWKSGVSAVCSYSFTAGIDMCA